ncbi:hypothetical protein OIU84_024059 [Salix udensis]|uniref:Serine/threonine-protein phosphatase n=1 Tax=Salix udensis TaxID=889485 RepID=A0AAD6KGL5_9ROSI|nr:hypothetical protein OIU84_024059 [Salix udensis]
MSDSMPFESTSDQEPATNSPEEAATATATSTTTISSTPEGPPPPPIQIPLSWPSNSSVTLDWIKNLISAFDWSSKNLPPSELPSVLPVPVFDALVLTASEILHREPNCVRIDDCNENSRVVVVGDIHGQLHDVMFLLQDAGFPCEDRFFVFNGDYVDRGAWGLETFLLLLAWKSFSMLYSHTHRESIDLDSLNKVFLPQRVFLLRGNHESKYCTSVYGFEKEVLAKYGVKVCPSPHQRDQRERKIRG